MRKILFLLPAALTASCALDQQPAPYEVYGSKFYGKGNSNDYAGNNAQAPSNSGQYSSNDPNAYNRQIDEQNSTRIVSHPIINSGPVTSRPVYGNEVYSQPVADSSGNLRRPLAAPVAIDSSQQSVNLSSRQSIHSGGSMGNSYDSARPYDEQNESVPPLERKEEGYLNISHLNRERKAEDKLDSVKPVSKPANIEADDQEDETAENETKITPKINKIETSSGAIGKSTAEMTNKQTEYDEEEEGQDLTASSEEENNATPAKKPSTQTASVEPAKVKPAEPKVAGAAPKFIKPVDGVVISEFGSDKATGGLNDGINIQAPEGTPVKAASSGTVVYSGDQLQGYGNLIIIRHPGGYLTAYSHMKELELKKGAAVAQGDIVGHVGKTGNVETPQLHFGIRKGREPVDPKNYL